MNNTINIGSVVKPTMRRITLFSSLHNSEGAMNLEQDDRALVLEVFRRIGVIHEFRVLTAKGTMGWVMSQDVELVK